MSDAYRTFRGPLLSRLGLMRSPTETSGEPELPAALHPIEFSQFEAICAALAPRRVVEWGSGGTTVAIPKRFPEIEQYLSVEHNATWHGRVRELADRDRVTVELCPPSDADPEPQMFDGQGQPIPEYAPWAERCEQDRTILQRYIEKPREHGDAFDLAFVDGRARVHCIAEAWSLLTDGGVLVVHDAQRESYHPALRALGPEPRWLDPWVHGQICIVRKS